MFAETDDLITHTIQNHKDETFSCKNCELDPASGVIRFRFYHFNASVASIRSRIFDGEKAILDLPGKDEIRFKRNQTDQMHSNDKETQIGDYLKLFYDILYSIDSVLNRRSDFINLLRAIQSGHLMNSIALHIMLDAGRFYGLKDIRQMRYVDESLNIWLTVKKLFKNKGINFFRGYMADGLQGNHGQVISPYDCKVNLVVPSISILRRESEKIPACIFLRQKKYFLTLMKKLQKLSAS